MSFFSKFQNSKIITSTLQSGDETIILKFKPISVRDFDILQNLQQANENGGNMKEVMTQACELLASLVLEGDWAKKPTKDDFLDLDLGTLIEIVTDVTSSINVKKKLETQE